MNRLERYILEHNTPFKLEVRYASLYYKWLSYKPQFLVDYINSLLNKCNLTEKEENDLISFREEEYILGELEKYINHEKYNYDKVSDYINSHSLRSIIHSRLTEEEVEKSRQNKDFNPQCHQYVIEPFNDDKILNFPGTMVDLLTAIDYAIKEEQELELDMTLQVAQTTGKMDKFLSIYGHSPIIKKWRDR